MWSDFATNRVPKMVYPHFHGRMWNWPRLFTGKPGLERLFSATGKTKRCLSYFSRCVGSRVYLTTCVFGSIACMDSGSRHHTPGQIITTSAEVTPKCGGFVRVSPQNTLKNYSNLLKIHHLIESCKPARNPWIQELFSMAHRRLDLVNAFCQHLCSKHSF